MERPFEAYDGDESYVFVCYAHDDKSLVYPELTRLKDAGFQIWYDEGIGPGSEWSDSIAKHIEHCASFLYFVTPRSVDREHCRRELNFAIDQSRRVLAVHLVPTELPSGLKLTLSNRQAILKHDVPRAVYEAKLTQAIGDARGHKVDRSAKSDRASSSHRWSPRWLIGVVAVAIAVGVSVRIAYHSSHHDSVPDRSIVVLSFSVVGGGAGATTYTEELTEELRRAVIGYQELRTVVAPDTTNVRDVSSASYVVSGNVHVHDDGVGVRASLTRTDDDQTVWAETFARGVADDNSDPAAMATTIGRFIRRQLVKDQRCESVRRAARSAEAAAAYCAASEENLRFQQTGDGDIQLQLSGAQHAVALDPEIADAYSLIAAAFRAYGSNGVMDWRDAARHANDALSRGLALAPDDPSVLLAQGWTRGSLEFNYPAAEASLEASLLSDPFHPEVQWNYVGLGDLALVRGNLLVASENYRRALRIDDASAGIYAYHAAALWFAGEHREAIRVSNAGLDLVQSGVQRFYLLQIKGYAHHSLGESAAANAALDDALRSVGPAWKPALAGPLAFVGRTDEARQLLAELEAFDLPPIEALVQAYAGLGDERVFESIHAAIDRHIWTLVLTLRSSPIFSAQRKDPRWAEVMKHLESEEAKGRALDQSET